MRPFIAGVLLLLCAAIPASAQIISFGIGPDLTFPSADLKNNVATGFGATGLAKFGLLPIVDLTAGVEYIKFTDKDITLNNLAATGTGSAFAVLIGGRINVLLIGYAGLETGTCSYTKKSGSNESNITRGLIAPMLGVKLGMFDVCARYVSAGDDSFWGLRGLIWF